MIVHASNEAARSEDRRTLCDLLFARRSKGWHNVMATLSTTSLAHADGLTNLFDPIMLRFDARVTCPLCRDVVRQKVAALQQGLGAIERPAIEGCGDSGCICRPTSGMATNGGCRCDDRAVRRALVAWRRYAGELEARVT